MKSMNCTKSLVDYLNPSNGTDLYMVSKNKCGPFFNENLFFFFFFFLFFVNGTVTINYRYIRGLLFFMLIPLGFFYHLFHLFIYLFLSKSSPLLEQEGRYLLPSESFWHLLDSFPSLLRHQPILFKYIE